MHQVPRDDSHMDDCGGLNELEKVTENATAEWHQYWINSAEDCPCCHAQRYRALIAICDRFAGDFGPIDSNGIRLLL